MLIIGDIKIAYEEAGPATPLGTVVLVHGGTTDMRLWEHQFRALSERYRVIRYDRRGCGRSGDAAGEVCHHEDLLAVMDALGVERAALAGSSMGGAYATEVALAAPARVAALALIGSGLAGHPWPQEMLDQARERVHGSVPADRLARYRDGTADHVDPPTYARWRRPTPSGRPPGPTGAATRSPTRCGSRRWRCAASCSSAPGAAPDPRNAT